MESAIFKESLFELVRSLVRQTNLKRKIILILTKKDDITITELQDELEKRKDHYNYRTVWQHVSSLEAHSIVQIRKEDHKPGKPVMVTLAKVYKKNADDLRKALLQDYPHYKIPEEEKKIYG